MKRKIVQQGPTTLMISLPIKWVRKYGLAKGEEINLEEYSRKLIVSTEKEIKKSKVEISLDSTDKTYIWRCLQAPYISGYDEIKINFSNPKILDPIQELVISSLTGFELVEQEKNHCTIKSVLKEQNNQFPDILRKVFLNLLHMSEIIKTFFEKGENPKIILNLELTNNRNTMFLKRILNKEGYQDENKKIFFYNLVLFLEKIANEYKFLVLYNQSKKLRISKNIVQFYAKIDQELLELYNSFYSYTPDKAKNIILKGIREEEIKSLFKEDPELAYYFMKITDFIRTSLLQVMAINS